MHAHQGQVARGQIRAPRGRILFLPLPRGIVTAMPAACRHELYDEPFGMSTDNVAADVPAPAVFVAADSGPSRNEIQIAEVRNVLAGPSWVTFFFYLLTNKNVKKKETQTHGPDKRKTV